ncbi:hypothetical protein [Rosistilla oblonga]
MTGGEGSDTLRGAAGNDVTDGMTMQLAIPQR